MGQSKDEAHELQEGQEEADKRPEHGSPSSRLQSEARRFLRDSRVKAAEPHPKTDFLRTKGLDEEQITDLLRETATDADPSPSAGTSNSRPLIVTYLDDPILTPLPQPPTLVTFEGLARASYALSVAAMLAYGAARFIFAPMTEARDDALRSLYAGAASGLADLTSQLDGMVSVPSSPPPAIEDDPAKLFSRDIGTQTAESFPRSSVSSQRGLGSARPAADQDTPAERELDQINRVTAVASLLRNSLSAQAEDMADIRERAAAFRIDLQKLLPNVLSVPSWALERESEPDDEVRRVRDSIRAVKGELLNPKSFPSVKS